MSYIIIIMELYDIMIYIILASAVIFVIHKLFNKTNKNKHNIETFPKFPNKSCEYGIQNEDRVFLPRKRCNTKKCMDEYVDKYNVVSNDLDTELYDIPEDPIMDYNNDFFTFRNAIYQNTSIKEDPVDRMNLFDEQQEGLHKIKDVFDRLTKN